MLTYAYERKLLVQPLINFGVEKALDEYTFLKDWKESVVIEYSFGEVINPDDYKTLDEFLRECERSFYLQFDRTHAVVSKANQRYDQLVCGEEKLLFYSLPVDQRSITMAEYVRTKKKRD